MISFKIFTKRFIRRIKYAFNFKDMLYWKYESCQVCGSCFHLVWSVKDDKWLKVNNTDSGLLCLDCFINKANRHKIELNSSDIDKIELFNPLD